MPNLIAIDLSGSETTTIPAYAFTQKKFLLRVRLPHGLKTIGQRAFSGCGCACGSAPPSNFDRENSHRSYASAGTVAPLSPLSEFSDMGCR